jgi:hypothetical protein
MRAPCCGRGIIGPLSALLVLLLVFAPLAKSKAQGASNETLFAVKGVPANDVLNVRDAPNGNQVVGRIPPSARGVIALGPRKKDQGTWAQVRYGDVVGWVNVRFLAPDTTRPVESALSRPAATSALGSEAAVRGRLFEGVWGHEQWSLTIDAEQLALLPAQTGSQPARILALGSRECGVVYERNFAAIDIDDIASTFTDKRFQAWARASTRDRVVAVMIVTCGALSHRFFVFLSDTHKMLVAEWDEKAWLMYEEFTAGSRHVGRQ